MIDPHTHTKTINEKAFDKMNEAKANLRKGCLTFVTAVGRMFLEAWIVQLIWNWVVVDNTQATELAYWETFFGIIAVRIIIGQMKVGAVKIDNKKDKDKDKNKDKKNQD